MGAPEFVHLHVHSEFTMLDGSIRIPELVARSVELQAPAVCVTDRSNMYGAVQLHKAAKGAGIKAILGAEIQIVKDLKRERGPDPGHLLLLAESQEGYQNIVRLVSLGWVDGLIDDTPRIDLEVLAQHSEGVVALTACMAGYVPQRVLMEGPEAGREALTELREIFGPQHLFVELEDHGFPENRPLNNVLSGLAKELDLGLVATNCAHFTDREMARAQLVLQCIGASRTIREMEATHHGSSEMYLKTAEQMHELFRDYEGATANTMAIAERCAGAADPLSKPKLPRFPIPDVEGVETKPTEAEYLGEIARKMLEERFDEMRALELEFDIPTYEARLEEELGIINSMGFPGYFLIVQDFINWAKDNDVPVGPGRGSGAGSLVAYALRITNLDPIPYALFFERFLNPERVSMPDFDIDFCMDKRDKVIDYVRHAYGHQSVGQIATFHQLKSKSVVRDVGRVMGMPPADAGRVAGLIPDPVQGKNVPIGKALEEEPRLKEVYENDREVHELIDTAQQLENLTRHAGMHAAGVVISEGPIWDHVPVFCPETDVYVTQYHKDDVEAAGLVKFDFLGLKTLTVLDYAEKLINKRPDRSEPFVLDSIPLTDVATFALLQSGETTNVFQLESEGMQSFFKVLKPDCFEDIIAAVALYRPGPMSADMHMTFAERKHGRQAVSYPHENLEPILRDTRGVIVYQEQVMQIARDMAGYSLGGADLLRRAMGKKKASEMEKQRKIFVSGSIERGYAEEKAGEVFDLMEGFAAYGFNKSHSAAYALIAYQTAYLKAHYPAEFACATMSADKDKSEKVVRTVSETRTMGITVLPPDVNESEVDFTVVYHPEEAKGVKREPNRPVSEKGVLRDPMGPKIRFGLGALKGIGGSALDAIFEARTKADTVPGTMMAPGQGGTDEATHEDPFVDLFDFCDRVDLRRVNKNSVEALVMSGALDGIHAHVNVHRAQAFAAIETAVDRGKRAAAERASGQTNLFAMLGADEAIQQQQAGGVFPPDIPPWDSKETLQREKQTLGFYVSGHPLDRYAKEMKRFCNADTESMQASDRGFKAVIGGTVEGYRERRTRSGGTIAFFDLEDPKGRVEVIVRPKFLEPGNDVREVLKSGEPILLEGGVKLEQRGEDAEIEPKLLLERVTPLVEALGRKAKSVNVSLEVAWLDRRKLQTLRATLERFPGPVPVSLELKSPGKWQVSLLETDVYVEPSDQLLASLERLFGERVTELR